MKRKFIKASNYALGLLLISIGFSSCNKDDDDGRIMLMYGTPSADYEMSGKVTDNENNPIAGIKVSHPRSYTNAGQEGVITDKDGNYKLNTKGFAPGELKLTIEDIDGVVNGEFATKQKTETFKDSDYTGKDGAWHEGKATRTVNIKLTEKITLTE